MSWEEASVIRFDGMVSETKELGAMTVARHSIRRGFDSAPLYRGLPDDLCPCEHWVYLASGELRYRFADGDELALRAGEAAHVRGGHLAEVGAESVLIELTPTEQHRRKAAHLKRVAEGAPRGEP
jgi:hypothetical protein